MWNSGSKASRIGDYVNKKIFTYNLSPDDYQFVAFRKQMQGAIGKMGG